MTFGLWAAFCYGDDAHRFVVHGTLLDDTTGSLTLSVTLSPALTLSSIYEHIDIYIYIYRYISRERDFTCSYVYNTVCAHYTYRRRRRRIGVTRGVLLGMLESSYNDVLVWSKIAASTISPNEH